MRMRNRSACRRAGFTITELLVVVAIIGVLVSLTAAAVMRLIPLTQTNNTKAELTKLETELQKEYRAATDKYSKEPIPNQGTALGNAYWNFVVPTATNSSGQFDPNLARVIWTKLRLKQTFPTSFNEALNPFPMPPNTGYANQLTVLGYTTANTTSPQPWESSACLLLALGRSEDGAGVTPDVLGVASYSKDYGTPSNGSIKGLVDGWGNPLVFSRWPVASTVLNPNPAGAPQPKANNDPADPSGLLESSLWQQNNSAYTNFTTWCHPVGKPAAGGDATSYRVFPLVVSGGANPGGQVGLNATTFQVTNAGLANNVLYPQLAPPSQ
ncbi:MAG TPA: type II secretion system protein [Gemmataceae bacterium]|nr:type II secretion system protein [Gemmataceae bacterium]